MRSFALLALLLGACAANLGREGEGAGAASPDAIAAPDAFTGFDAAGGGGEELPDATNEQVIPDPPSIPTGVTPVNLLPRGATWRYLDDGSDQGTAWSARTFDASLWASGTAELGYGDGDEGTVVAYGPDPAAKYVTTYFRKSGVQIVDPSLFVAYAIDLHADDGAIVYVNGTEVVRLRMPATADYLTLASSSPGTERFVQFDVPSELIRAGSNVVAVEVHQVSRGSSDISFDLDLIGIPAPVAAP